MTVTIAIVGRPNVGKSTLFNRLIGKKLALVDDQPGVTRDLREAKTKLKNSEIKIIDTAGLENGNELSLQGRMTSLSLSAIETAHVCLFVIDVREGVTTSDNFYASLVRKTGKQVILVANKVEGSEAKNSVYEAFSLGLGNPVAISAEHGIGIDTLKLLIYELVQPVTRDENRTLPEKKRNKNINYWSAKFGKIYFNKSHSWKSKALNWTRSRYYARRNLVLSKLVWGGFSHF